MVQSKAGVSNTCFRLQSKEPFMNSVQLETQMLHILGKDNFLHKYVL